MVNAISIGHNPLIPGAVDAPPAAQPKPVVPGFDPAGQALPDAQVWSTKIGSRALDTADGIDGWERKALLKSATKSPQAFIQRLLADSKNGTPVELSFTRELSVGVLRVDFTAVDGKFDSTASIDVFNKKVDGFLKPYMAQDARDKGARAKIALGVKGDLTEAGGVDNLQLEIKATNVPRFSVGKLLELDTFQKDLKKALGADTGKKAKQDEVMSLVSGAINKLAEVPLPFLMKLINDSDVIKAELTSKGHDGRATVKVGGGNFSVGLRDVIGSDKSEPDIRLSLTGRSRNGGDTVQVDELRVFNQEKLAIEFAGTTPVVSRIKKNGEREAVNDHLGEAMAYLPMALALAGEKGVF